MEEILKLEVGMEKGMMITKLSSVDGDIDTVLKTIGILENAKQQQLNKLNSLLKFEQNRE